MAIPGRVGWRSINLLKNLLAFAIASLMAAARGHAFKSGSLSFLAARIVAGKGLRISAAHPSSPPAETGQQDNTAARRLARGNMGAHLIAREPQGSRSPLPCDNIH